MDCSTPMAGWSRLIVSVREDLSMKRRTIATALLASTLLLGSVVVCAPHPAAAAGACVSIATAQQATNNGNGTTSGTIASGLLQGTTQATFTNVTAVSSPPGLLYTSVLVIRTANGTLSSNESGFFDTSRLVFAEAGRVTSGTGLFAGAAGHLLIAGRTVDGVHFQDYIAADICLAG
jgi:hypothetical protein